MHLEYPYSVHHSIIPDNLCNEIIEEGEKLIKWDGLERKSGITHGCFMLSLNQVDIDYHGCYFELAYGAPWTQNYLNRFDELKKGTLIVFPSFLYYRFSPVMGGDRKIISGNLIGPAFA